MRAILLAAFSACWAKPAAAGMASAAPPAVSSAAVKVYTVNDLYGGAKFRDPFRPLGGVGAAPVASAEAATYNPEQFSIHSLNLKGMLKDPKGAYAVLVDAQSGVSFVLKNGLLFDYKNKRVPGVTGTVQMRQKTVVLMTPDKDVQTLRLGDNEGDAQNKAP